MRHIWVSPALVLAGCSGAIADGDGRAFGKDLGTFQVKASLDSSSCGAGALGSPDDWKFDIRLSRDDPELYWNTGAASVVGHIANDGHHFSFQSRTDVDASPASEDGPGCSITRSDSAEGRLDDPGLDVRHFEGKLVYKYDAQAGSDCSRMVGVPGGFQELPCTMSYAIEASRDKPPQHQ